MFKINNIGKWPMFIILISIILSVSANADDEQLNDSEYDDELPAFNYDPEIFEKIKNESWFITTRGTMPVITNAAEEAEWEKKAEKCIHSFSDELQPYMKSNGGPLIGFGYFYAGYLNVFIDEKSPESVNDSFFDEIYLIISDHCEQEGISEVPVVFMKSSTIILDLDEAESSDPLDEGVEVVEDTTNLPASEEENAVKLNNSNNNSGPDNGSSSTGNESSKNNTTLGFGLLGSLTCLYAAWKLRTK